MLIVAIDASTDRLSVAAGSPNGPTSERTAPGARRHAGLLVTFVDATVAELKAKGVHVFREDERREGVFTGRSAYFHDPDNNALEVIHLTNNAKA